MSSHKLKRRAAPQKDGRTEGSPDQAPHATCWPCLGKRQSNSGGHLHPECVIPTPYRQRQKEGDGDAEDDVNEDDALMATVRMTMVVKMMAKQ